MAYTASILCVRVESYFSVDLWRSLLLNVRPAVQGDLEQCMCVGTVHRHANTN